MSISENIQERFNEQIQKEFFSEYLYTSMEAYFKHISLDGFANYFHVQALEEHDHAMMFFNYILETGGKVELRLIEKPKNDFQSAKEVFQLSLDHEKFVTKSIHGLVDAAQAEKDYTAITFLQWFITEQREEESSMDRVLNKLKLVEGDGRGLLLLDQELALRVYTPPVNVNTPG
jgi:Ferritin-like protein